MTELPVFSNPYSFDDNFTKKLFGYTSKFSIKSIISVFLSLISFFWVYQLFTHITITMFRLYYLNKVSDSKLVFNVSLILFILWVMIIPTVTYSLIGLYGIIIIPLMFFKMLSNNYYKNLNTDELTIKIDQLVEEIQKNEKNVKLRITKIDVLLTYKTILSKVKSNTGNVNLSYVMFNLMFIFDKYFTLNETRIYLLEKEFEQVYKHLALLK